MEANPTVEWQPRKIGIILFGIVIFLQIINLISVYLDKILNWDNFTSHAITYYFDVSREGNIPELFSALILFISSALLFLIFRLTRSKSIPQRKYWLALSLIFLFLTADEATQIHEQFNKLKTVLPDMNGALTYPWIVSYSILALIIGLWFIRFLIQLPRKTRILFMISGFIYVGSALGFEILEGYAVRQDGMGSLQDRLWCSLEEFLEMSGIVLFIYSLLKYLEDFCPQIHFRLKGSSS